MQKGASMYYLAIPRRAWADICWNQVSKALPSSLPTPDSGERAVSSWDTWYHTLHSKCTVPMAIPKHVIYLTGAAGLYFNCWKYKRRHNPLIVRRYPLFVINGRSHCLSNFCGCIPCLPLPPLSSLMPSLSTLFHHWRHCCCSPPSSFSSTVVFHHPPPLHLSSSSYL